MSVFHHHISVPVIRNPYLLLYPYLVQYENYRDRPTENSETRLNRFGCRLIDPASAQSISFGPSVWPILLTQELNVLQLAGWNIGSKLIID